MRQGAVNQVDMIVALMAGDGRADGGGRRLGLAGTMGMNVLERSREA
jgi:hypothetical protein